MSSCDRCFNPDKGRACINCERNPDNPIFTDNFVDYPICCPFHFVDCINDPGYLWVFHRDCYNDWYGDTIPTPGMCDCDCHDGDRYDDEDK